MGFCGFLDLMGGFSDFSGFHAVLGIGSYHDFGVLHLNHWVFLSVFFILFYSQMDFFFLV